MTQEGKDVDKEEMQTLDSPPDDLPRRSVGCQEELMTAACLGPAVIKWPKVFRQASMGCAIEAPKSPAAISSCKSLIASDHTFGHAVHYNSIPWSKFPPVVQVSYVQQQRQHMIGVKSTSR